MRETPGHRRELIERIDSLRVLSRTMAVVLVLFTLTAYLAVHLVTVREIKARLRSEAASYAGIILTTREWNAEHTGVYVVKSSEATTNPFLRTLGIEPDVDATGGLALTLRNPAAMTREISELTVRGDGIAFRLTSLKPVNPAAAPDAWERTGLERFATDRTPQDGITKSRSARRYRYMVPLYVTEPCLTCHRRQGYQVGDLRGGLVVSVPYEPTAAAIRLSAIWLSTLALLTALLLAGAFGALFRWYRLRLEEAGLELERVAMTDALTELPNRRTAMERLGEEVERSRRSGDPLSVVAMDIDRFKLVNDTAGHAAGDEVLREIAARLASCAREYDMIARMGGEEFLAIAPGASASDALSLAHRLLDAVRGEPVVFGETSFAVTLSAGVASLEPGEECLDPLLARADTALYAAKAEGRDRVNVAGPAPASAEPESA